MRAKSIEQSFENNNNYNNSSNMNSVFIEKKVDSKLSSNNPSFHDN